VHGAVSSRKRGRDELEREGDWTGMGKG